MASLYTNQTLPATSEAAIREFNELYLTAISAAQPPTWASEFGDVIDLSAPRATFPMSIMSTKYLETKEESSTFKTMKEKSFDLKVVEFDSGYEVQQVELVSNAYAYRNWGRVPDRFLLAEGRHVNRQIVTLIEAGTSGTTPWDGLAFFSTAHLANPGDSTLGTFSNYNNAGVDPASVTNISAEMTSMRGVLDENGDKMGIEPDTILLPTAKFQSVSNLLNQNMIGNGESNPLLGKLRVVHVPELTDANDWYLLDSKAIGMGISPWVAGRYRPADTLGLRFWDESSDFYKNTSKIKVSSHLWYGFAMVFPHAIRRVAGA